MITAANGGPFSRPADALHHASSILQYVATSGRQPGALRLQVAGEEDVRASLDEQADLELCDRRVTGSCPVGGATRESRSDKGQRHLQTGLLVGCAPPMHPNLVYEARRFPTLLVSRAIQVFDTGTRPSSMVRRSAP